MKQNRGVGRKILPWILAVVFGAVVLVGVSVFVNPDAILPVDWAEKVHKFKKNVGLEEKYNGYDYRTLEGGGEQILISEDEVVYAAPDEDVAVNDTGREYPNNVMSITTYELLEDSTVEELLHDYGAKVVGYSRGNNHYIVKFPMSYGLEEIYQLREDLGKIPEFEAVNIGYLSGDSTKLIPNDAMWNEKDPNSEWSDSVGSSGVSLYELLF